MVEEAIAESEVELLLVRRQVSHVVANEGDAPDAEGLGHEASLLEVGFPALDAHHLCSLAGEFEGQAALASADVEDAQAGKIGAEEIVRDLDRARDLLVEVDDALFHRPYRLGEPRIVR